MDTQKKRKGKRLDNRYYKRLTHELGQRWRPGTQALLEIRHYQRTTELVLPKAPFARYVLVSKH